MQIFSITAGHFSQQKHKEGYVSYPPPMQKPKVLSLVFKK